MAKVAPAKVTPTPPSADSFTNGSFKSDRDSLSFTRRSSSMSDLGSDQHLALKMSVANRLAERKQLEAEKRSFLLDTCIDAFDISFKSIALLVWATSHLSAQREFLVFYIASIAVCSFMVSLVLYVRRQQLKEMAFVVERGYSRTWHSSKRLNDAFGGGKDPRIDRDAKARQELQWRLRSVQAFICDLPWILINVARASTYQMDAFAASSIVVAGFGFGMKFSQMLSLFRLLFITKDSAKKRAVYQKVPADLKISTGVSHLARSDDALAQAMGTMWEQMGEERSLSLILVFMTSNHDHAAALSELRRRAPGVPYSGCTTCMGVMEGKESKRDPAGTVAVWAISDPEGMYSCGVADLADLKDGDTPFKVAEREMGAMLNHATAQAQEHTDRPVIQMPASFVWLNCPPGPEDQVLDGFRRVLSDEVDLVGGTAADNSITGEWRQWSSASPDVVYNHAVAFVMCHCSGLVQGALQTGYTPSPFTGTVTDASGPRHIQSINGQPAAEVYNRWCQDAFVGAMEEPEANILGPSSLYPLGQVCSTDDEGEPIYRSMHPHLIIKASKSLTIFSDVRIGEQICLMTGTPNNLVIRAAKVAKTIVQQSSVSSHELRGALVCFCAGAMLWLESDENMTNATVKLDEALGGMPYIGIHPFGEQGPFSGGQSRSRHGNLMFSAVTFTSRRRVEKIVNVDTGVELTEDNPEFAEVLLSGGIITEA